MRENISHRERLTRDNSILFKDMPPVPEVQLMSVSEKVENDVVVKHLDIKFEHEINDNSNLKVSDFKIENLEATGAIKGLRLYSTKPDMRAFEAEIVDFEKTIDEYEKENKNKIN